MWQALTRDELRLTVFVDDSAVTLRNVFRDFRVLRRFMEVVRMGPGFGFDADTRSSTSPGGHIRLSATSLAKGRCFRCRV